MKGDVKVIYTSYFAKINKLPASIVPISIAAKPPAGYAGLQYKKLAPKYGFFMEWKRTHDDLYYIKCFKEQVLDRLTVEGVLEELRVLVSNTDVVMSASKSQTGRLRPKADGNTDVAAVAPKAVQDALRQSATGGKEICLVCYEKPTNFCHRFLVAEWLRENGIACKEFNG